MGKGFEGRTAIVTGAGSGIGKAAAAAKHGVAGLVGLHPMGRLGTPEEG